MSADPFEPLQSVAALMAAYPRPWFLAGGWAIDLFLGRVRRSHKDVDIALLRRDQLAFQACFATWNLQKLVGPDGQERPEPWLPGEWLELPTFQVWMQRGSDGWPVLEVLFNESEGDEWRWRVNTQVAYPLAQMGGRSAQGWPYLDPALVLLFKSRHIFPDHRNNANDQQDFNDTAPLLNARQRAWLKVTLQRWYPEHSWIDHL